jgi:hypothetical protein
MGFIVAVPLSLFYTSDFEKQSLGLKHVSKEKNMDFYNNPELKLAYDFVRDSGCNIFLTGKAGTGKTTFLHHFKKESVKRLVVLAPTGVAAINAGGVTIHSFFQLPFGPQLPADVEGVPGAGEEAVKASAAKFQRFSREKINIIRSLDLLVIDEISMVRADLLDAVDSVLRRFRDRFRPFGGVQLLMIGDLQQLAPVVKEAEWEILKPYYDSAFFFSSRALQMTEFVGIELKKIYRQQDEAFIRLLNKVRDHDLDAESLQELNRRYVPGFSPGEREGYITLTTHNYQAEKINDLKLNNLKGKARMFKAVVTGEFSEWSYPTEAELTLKVEAQVMFVKNDISPLKLYYNGKIGKIVNMSEDLVHVQCPGDEEPIAVSPAEWQNCRYALDEETKKIKETIIGTFTQYPLKLAWAITIHKSQGLTFEKAIIDARAAFAHGQVYVALSRCTTLQGLVLSAPLGPQTIKSDDSIKNFTRQIEENPPGEEQFRDMKNAYQKSLVQDLFDFSGLERRLGYLRKLVRENQASIDRGLIDVLNQADHALKTEMAEVSGKFMKQVHQLIAENPDVENNPALQERIRKACLYFAPKMEAILLMVPEGPIETDNKTVRKTLGEALERFRADGFVKKECLAVCEKGFRPGLYLETRAKAAIEKNKEKKPAKPVQEFGAAKYPEFHAQIKAWRNRIADSLELPGHMVLPRRTLLEIADELPATRQALLKINGMGEKKVQRFGAEILEMTMSYRNKNNMAIPCEEPVPAKSKAPAKGESQKVSYELFLAGKTVAEIAAERDIMVNTVEGHLAVFVGTGQLPVEKLVAPEKIARISEYFNRVDNTYLGSAKVALGDDVSYGEIKCVLKHLDHLKSGIS